MDVGVFAYIRNQDGKVLLVKDATRQQLWTLPGGGPELGELMPETLMREVREETSCEIKPTQLLGVFSQKKTPGIVLLFEAAIHSGTPTPDGHESSECRFFSIDELISMREGVKPAQLSMIAQVEKAERFPIFNNFPSI